MNKVALITGGARRIGAETANYLHSKGINIVITYSKSSVAANALKKELNLKRKGSCHIYKAKFNPNINYKKITTDIIRLFGRLDYLINNASKFYPTKINEVTDKAWSDTIDTNIKTPLFLSKYFYNELKKRRGVIINIIDIHVEPPLKDHIIYNVSKAGLLALTRTLAKDLAPQIRVNGVSPGAIMWPENESSNKKKLDILSKIPMKSIGEPADIAKTIYFLLEQSPYVTGQNINVDGGRRLNM
jgi:pteridine reductase